MKQRFFTIGSVGIALVAGLLWVLQGIPRQEETPLPSTVSSPAMETPPELTPSATPPSADPKGSDLYSYSIATTDLLGLAPDVTPGTRLDLWVAVQPPIYKKADVLPLIEGALLAEIVPPEVPDGPVSAVLQVPLHRAHDLMWADRFGAISVLEVPVPRS